MIDSHTHLTDSKFDSDRDKIIEKSISSGIDIFLEILCSKDEWRNFKLVEKYQDNFLFSFGIHPHHTKELSNENLIELEKYLKLEKCVALGEAGLDLWYYPDKLKEQLSLLEPQIELANKLLKPIVFHIRNSKNGNDAYQEFFSFIKGRHKKQAVIHSFSGTLSDAKKAIDMGFYLGINATLSYPKNNELRETVKFTGTENLLTETDSPYLPPQRIRGNRNDPGSITDIIDLISSITSTDREKVTAETESNFKKLFLNRVH